MNACDAVVIGSGPNGLAAAVTLARAGRSVVVFEANEKPGGATRTEELTLPGFRHDLCSAVHPLAVAAPFFLELDLQKHGLEWITPPAQAAQTLEGGRSALLHLSVEETAAGLGEDGGRYRSAMAPLARAWRELMPEILEPLAHIPRHPFLLARFGLPSLRSAAGLARARFRTDAGQALFGGIAAHANAALSRPGTAAIGLMLNLAGHAKGWPIPRGGAQSIADSLISCLKAHGGELRLGTRVESLDQLPRAKAVFFDLTPRQILRLLEPKMSGSQVRAFQRFHYGPGVFKMDWALSAPIPWSAPEIAKSATVHVGANLAEMAESECLPEIGKHPTKPYVLLSQPTLFDPSRAPEGKHIAWAYCHVPNGSTVDMTEAIENQIERFAPGFRSRILARSTLNTVAIEAKNANLIGGDISGGAVTLKQLLFRPTVGLDPYRLSADGYYICSSSTPPGPGVHGMCGYNAARRALSSGSV